MIRVACGLYLVRQCPYLSCKNAETMPQIDLKMENRLVQQTKCWVKEVVIGLNLCPFAKVPAEKNEIRYFVASDLDPISCIESILAECIRLDNDNKIETTLVILPNGFDDFNDYLDLLDAATRILNDAGYAGEYQLASFHPEYQFQGSALNDPANYTNRSPYPTVHIIREESLERALTFYKGNPEEIPERNVALTRKMGLTQLKLLRESCF